MKVWRVFVIGDSLFADALICLLMSTGTVTVLGSAATTDTALALIQEQQPDALIEVGANALPPAELGQLLNTMPGFPIIRANLKTEAVQIITSQTIAARLADLLTALGELAERGPTKSLSS